AHHACTVGARARSRGVSGGGLGARSVAGPAFAGPGRDQGAGSRPAASWSIHALATASASRSLIRVTEMLRSPHDAATTTCGVLVAVSVTTPRAIPSTRALA